MDKMELKFRLVEIWGSIIRFLFTFILPVIAGVSIFSYNRSWFCSIFNGIFVLIVQFLGYGLFLYRSEENLKKIYRELGYYYRSDIFD